MGRTPRQLSERPARCRGIGEAGHYHGALPDGQQILARRGHGSELSTYLRVKSGPRLASRFMRLGKNPKISSASFRLQKAQGRALNRVSKQSHTLRVSELCTVLYDHCSLRGQVKLSSFRVRRRGKFMQGPSQLRSRCWGATAERFSRALNR